MKVVLDMDPGIDDAMALLLALNNSRLEILAVTTVSGNVNVDKATLNALKIIEAAGSACGQAPVYRGAGRPLNKRRHLVYSEDIHGKNGIGNVDPSPQLRAKEEKTSAVDKLVELLSSHKKKEISIVATGPLTNIAMLLQREPSAAKKLNQLYIMGGIYDNGLTKGNVTEHTEFNFFCDPEAAKIIMDNAERKGLSIIASGLDITSTSACAVRNDELGMICSIRSKIANIACKILQYPLRNYSFFNLHDVFALFSLLYQEIFRTQRCRVRVYTSGRHRGKCVVSYGKGNVQVNRQVDSVRFNKYLLDGLA
jgi:inosine-uridine nucleoside N-ribohydrolase